MWILSWLFSNKKQSDEVWEEKDDSKLVLIIEDEVLLSEMYKIKLELNQFKVEVRPDWESWLKAIEELKPDVVLLDLMMPVMNWLEVLDNLRNKLKMDTKVVVFSNAPEKKEEALDLWADEFLVKADVTPNEVLNTVLELV